MTGDPETPKQETAQEAGEASSTYPTKTIPAWSTFVFGMIVGLAFGALIGTGTAESPDAVAAEEIRDLKDQIEANRAEVSEAGNATPDYEEETYAAERAEEAAAEEEEEQVAKESPPPAPAPMRWTTTKTFSGSGKSKTEEFTIYPGKARVQWTMTGDSNTILELIGLADGSTDLLVNEIGNATGSSRIYAPGRYFFQADAAGSWTLTVQHMRPAR